MKTTAAQKRILAVVGSVATPCASLEGRAALSAEPLARAGMIEIVDRHTFNYFVRGVRHVDVTFSVRLTDAGRAAL